MKKPFRFYFEFSLENTYTVSAYVSPGYAPRGWDPGCGDEVDFTGPVQVWAGYGKRHRPFGTMAEFTEWITLESLMVEIALHHGCNLNKAEERLKEACVLAYVESYDEDDGGPYED